MLKAWQLWVLAILAVLAVGVWVLAIHTYLDQSRQMGEAFKAMRDYCDTQRSLDCFDSALYLYMNNDTALLECYKAGDYSACR